MSIGSDSVLTPEISGGNQNRSTRIITVPCPTLDQPREKVLYLWLQRLSRTQRTAARRILDGAVDELVAINAIGAADLLVDLKAALDGGAR